MLVRRDEYPGDLSTIGKEEVTLNLTKRALLSRRLYLNRNHIEFSRHVGVLHSSKTGSAESCHLSPSA